MLNNAETFKAFETVLTVFGNIWVQYLFTPKRETLGKSGLWFPPIKLAD